MERPAALALISQRARSTAAIAPRMAYGVQDVGRLAVWGSRKARSISLRRCCVPEAS